MIARLAARLMVVAAFGAAPVGATQRDDSSAGPDGPRFLLASAGGNIPVDAVRTPVLARRISLTLRDVTRKQALAEIARQAGLNLVYGDNLIGSDERVRLEAKGITVAAAFTDVLWDRGLDVVLSANRQVALVRRPSGAALRLGGTITGQVTDAQARARLRAADVLLEGTRWRTTSDTAGWYRLTDIAAGTYTLIVRQLGYAKWSRTVTVHDERDDTVHVALEPSAVALTDLIATATGPQRRRDLGNSITTIRADSVLRNAPIRNLSDLLQDRVPGLTVQHSSGAPGDPARLRLRGLGSLQRSNDPVVIVDGIRVYSAQSEARSGNLTNSVDAGAAGPLSLLSTPAPSPLDQIDPNTIETVEVFKGPSAATLYGADAANGVIVITTKKGKPGPTRWHASIERGRTKTLGRYPVGYYRWGHDLFEGFTTFCKINNPNCAQDSLVQFQALNEPSLTPLGQGQRTAASLTASGGSQALTYSITGTYGDETGLLKLPDFEVDRFRATFNREAPDWMQRPHRLKQWAVTSNVNARIGATSDVALTASVGRTQQQRSDLENRLASMAATYIDTINRAYYRSSLGGGLAATTAVLSDYYARTTASSIAFTTGLNATWRPRAWLNFLGRAGINVIPRDDQRLLPAGMLSPDDSGAFRRGTGQSLVSTFTVQGNVRRPLPRGFAFETNVGVDLTTQSTGDLAANALGLVPGTSTIGGASHISATDASLSTSVFGWHIEPRLQGQRFSVSTGFRLDGGSAYGARVTGLGGGLLALPKLNGSWVISEEPFFPFKSLFSSFRLRGAYGQAQVQPGPADRLRLYRYPTPSNPPSVELTTLGNTRLKPERSTEFEGGFDADLSDSRFSIEVTAYRKTQVDALMGLTVPPSVDGGGTVMTNVGTIRNTGVELLLRLSPLRSPRLAWSTELTYSGNRNELVRLGQGVVANRDIGLVPGYPVGGRWSKPILGYSDMNKDGVLQDWEVLIGDSAVFMGRLYPAYRLALHSGLTMFGGAFGVSAGLTYDAGMTQVDQTAGDNWVLSRALADPAAPLDQQAAALSYVRTTYGATQEVSTFRFNELSINYQAPPRIARLLHAQRLTLALQGRNLALHSTYHGKDPDVNQWAPGEGIVDDGQLTQPRTWQVRVDLDY